MKYSQNLNVFALQGYSWLKHWSNECRTTTGTVKVKSVYFPIFLAQWGPKYSGGGTGIWAQRHLRSLFTPGLLKILFKLCLQNYDPPVRQQKVRSLVSHLSLIIYHAFFDRRKIVMKPAQCQRPLRRLHSLNLQLLRQRWRRRRWWRKNLHSLSQRRRRLAFLYLG